VTGECATSDVPETVTTPTASSPLDATTQTSNALKHGECITEDDEDEKIESSPSTREPTFFPPVRFSDNLSSYITFRVNFKQKLLVLVFRPLVLRLAITGVLI
jgi:hypothetical protein